MESQKLLIMEIHEYIHNVGMDLNNTVMDIHHSAIDIRVT